jgi:hypothetical protein
LVKRSPEASAIASFKAAAQIDPANYILPGTSRSPNHPYYVTIEPNVGVLIAFPVNSSALLPGIDRQAAGGSIKCPAN